MNNNKSSKYIILNNNDNYEKVYLIQENKELLLLTLQEALNKANETFDSLIQLSIKNEIPICKIIDISALEYSKEKKNKQQKKNITQVKKIKISPNIDDYDLQRKISNIKLFIQKKFICYIIVFYKKGLKRKMNKENSLQERIEKNDIILKEVKQNQFLVSLKI